MVKRGKLIVIEGTDASGKETQTLEIIKRLRGEGINLASFSFPRYDTPTGDVVKRYLGKSPYGQEFGPVDDVNPKVASVFYALDRLATAPLIESELEAGNHVFCNRYVESNMGHQGGKIKDSGERALFIDWLDKLEYGSFNLPRPDLVLFLYMPHSVAFQLRGNRGGEADGHEANPQHLLNAERTYIELAEKFKWTRIDCAPNGKIGSLKSVRQVGDEVYSHVKSLLNN